MLLRSKTVTDCVTGLCRAKAHAIQLRVPRISRRTWNELPARRPRRRRKRCRRARARAQGPKQEAWTNKAKVCGSSTEGAGKTRTLRCLNSSDGLRTAFSSAAVKLLTPRLQKQAMNQRKTETTRTCKCLNSRKTSWPSDRNHSYT